MFQFQGLVGIFLTSLQLFDAEEIELFVGERVPRCISVEGILSQQGHYHSVWKLISERVIAFEVTFRVGVRVSADLTPHSGVAHDSYDPPILGKFRE